MTPEFVLAHIDEFGTPTSYNHYAVGWAHAMDTPYQWTKQVASHWGGTRNGTIVHWPSGIKAKGEVRRPVPSRDRRRADGAGGRGLPEPVVVNGVQQKPLRGREHGLLLRRGQGATTGTTTQYFEMWVNRGIYHKGWTAVTRHSLPW